MLSADIQTMAKLLKTVSHALQNMFHLPKVTVLVVLLYYRDNKKQRDIFINPLENQRHL